MTARLPASFAVMVDCAGMSTTRLSITRPDDWHVHLRDGEMLDAVVADTAATFARAIVMPNLVPPVTTTALAASYRERIRAALPPGSAFEPLMTCYLTDTTDPDDIAQGYGERTIHAVKLYPAGATTNAEAGVTQLRHVTRVLERLQAIGMPLLIHAEVVDADVDVFDREAAFIDRHLEPMLRTFPALRVVLEHVTTREGVAFVTAAGPNVAATITPHHLMINRNALFSGGLRPHYYCLPVAKRETHRLALRHAATSGNPKFFLGTDSAPHLDGAKESACGCAGIYNAPNALACYAQVFDEENALDQLQAFASEFGPRFYGLPVNDTHVTLSRVDEHATVPPVPLAGDRITPFVPPTALHWRVDGGDF